MRCHTLVKLKLHPNLMASIWQECFFYLGIQTKNVLYLKILPWHPTCHLKVGMWQHNAYLPSNLPKSQIYIQNCNLATNSKKGSFLLNSHQHFKFPSHSYLIPIMFSQHYAPNLPSYFYSCTHMLLLQIFLHSYTIDYFNATYIVQPSMENKMYKMKHKTTID